MIRNADVYDIPRINELGTLLNPNFKNVFNINEMLEDKISKVIVSIQDDKVVGFITATDLGETCDILDIIVDPDYRRKLIASNLITYLISELSPTLRLITLEVATKNQAAINLYEKFGFEIVNQRNNYYKDDNAYLMARKCE